TSDPVVAISGENAAARVRIEYVLTSNAVATELHGAARKLPPRQSSGAKPMACTTPSMPPQVSRTRAAAASTWVPSVTSISNTSGGGERRWALRRVRLMALPNDVRSTSAPARWLAAAMAYAMLLGVSTPVTS